MSKSTEVSLWPRIDPKAALCSPWSCPWPSEPEEAELILHNGRIWTGNEGLPWAQSLAIDGDTIVAVGSDQQIAELYEQDTERLDLQGRLCIPGLWDAHIHFYCWSLGLREVNLVGSRSLEDMQGRIERAMQTSEGAWCTGWGWDESIWEAPVCPNRHDIDEVTGLERPALFYRSDLHSAVANTRALQLAGLFEEGLTVEGGVVERDDQGRPTGVLRELAVNLVKNRVPKPSQDFTDEALLQGVAALHKFGITGICEQRIKDQEDGPEAWAAFSRLNEQGQLKLRVSCNIAAHDLDKVEARGLRPNLGDEHLRVGHIKVFADGTLGSRSAAVLEPFWADPSFGEPNYGMMLTPLKQISSDIQRSVKLGFPVSIHAIGDAANRHCLDLFAKFGESPDLPHRLEHVQLLADQDVSRLAELGITASMQPGHLLDDLDIADQYLGERSRLAYRFRSLQDSGALLAFGSDAPVSDVNPFYGIHGAVARQRPERMSDGAWHKQELLTLQETMLAYTIGAARAAGWDGITGSLEAGKRADLCVLDRDIFGLWESGTKGDELSSTQVLLTMVAGEIVHSKALS